MFSYNRLKYHRAKLLNYLYLIKLLKFCLETYFSKYWFEVLSYTTKNGCVRRWEE